MKPKPQKALDHLFLPQNGNESEPVSEANCNHMSQNNFSHSCTFTMRNCNVNWFNSLPVAESPARKFVPVGMGSYTDSRHQTATAACVGRAPGQSGGT